MTMDAWIGAVIALLCAGLGTPCVCRRLLAKGVLDQPNERSSHALPTPRGGGIAVVTALTLAGGWLVFRNAAPTGTLYMIIAILILGGVSWRDDIKNLSARVRLGAQVVVVASMIAIEPSLIRDSLPFLPSWLAIPVGALAWLWFINLFNFMDGIDGISGIEAISIAGGVAVLCMTGLAPINMFGPALMIGAAALGFLAWNWHPAKIFLGDVGSVPLGFALGWLLFELARAGHWPAALILPGYYIADATITLLRRLIRGEKVWEAHKSHFYQRAHQRGLTHDQISTRVLYVNMGLIGLAVLAAIGHSAPAGIGAVVVIGVLLWHFNTTRGNPLGDGA